MIQPRNIVHAVASDEIGAPETSPSDIVDHGQNDKEMHSCKGIQFPISIPKQFTAAMLYMAYVLSSGVDELV